MFSSESSESDFPCSGVSTITSCLPYAFLLPPKNAGNLFGKHLISHLPFFSILSSSGGVRGSFPGQKKHFEGSDNLGLRSGGATSLGLPPLAEVSTTRLPSMSFLKSL